MGSGTWDAIPARVRAFTGQGQSIEQSATPSLGQLFYNSERNLWAFGRQGTWTVSASLCSSYKIDQDGGAVLTRGPRSYFGHATFYGRSNSHRWALFFSVANRWALMHPGAAGAIEEPWAYQGLDGAWNGKAFYLGDAGNLPAPGGSGMVFSPAGTLLDDDPPADSVTLTPWWPRWEREYRAGDTAPCGVYHATDYDGSAPDDVEIGFDTWFGNGQWFERSLAKDASGHYRYGSIAWSDAFRAWCPGGSGAIRSSREPNKDSPVDFKSWAKDANGVWCETEDVAFTLSYVGKRPGTKTADRFFAEMFGWRL